MDQGASFYHHQGERGGRGRSNCDRSRRSRMDRGERGGGSGDGGGGIRDPEDEGGGLELGGRKRGDGRKTRPYMMEALYDYDPHVYSPNVDVEVNLTVYVFGFG